MNLLLQNPMRALVILLCFFASNTARAQPPQLPGGFVVDTANKNLIRLVGSDMGTFIMEQDVTLNVITGNVVFEHQGDRLYADSARLNMTKNVVHAYGNVKVVQSDGTLAYADRMYYDGNSKNVELIGKVELISQSDFLWSERIDYNLGTKIGKYNTGGTLQSGSTIIESRAATYYGKTDDARFKGDVNVLDPEYEVVSSDLNYNTKSRIVTFYGPSIINNDSSTLYTSSGTYDSEQEVAIFRKRSSIISGSQYMEADSMYYDRKTGLGVGTGNVLVMDTVRNSTMYCQLATVNELTKQVMATIRPYAELVRDGDTTYVKADTFFTEPKSNLLRFKTPITAQDSLLQALDILYRDLGTGILLDSNLVQQLDSLHENTLELIDNDSLFDFRTPQDSLMEIEVPTDTFPQISAAEQVLIDSLEMLAVADSLDIELDLSEAENWAEDEVDVANEPSYIAPQKDEDPRYFIAYRNVLVYSDSFQARADSMSYSQEDSLMQFHKKPVLWARDAQITGDVIIALVDTNEIRWVRIPKNGIIINQSTKANEVMFDQIQGNVIWAYFSNNETDSIVAMGNAETIYYITDEDDAYMGVSEASAANLRIDFYTDSSGRRAIKQITFYRDANRKTTPMRQSKPESLRLNRFQWRNDERVHSLEDFFKEVEQPRITDNSLHKEDIKNQLQRSEN